MKKNNPPIILVHQENKARGSSRYLTYVLKQARFYNPDTRIILLGNERNNIYPFIEHFNIDEFFDGAKAFAEDDYKHMSNHKVSYELFCYQRWFIIREFIEKENISSFCYLDSDVLVFTDLKQYFSKIDGEKFDLIGNTLTASGSFNPAINFYSERFLFQFTDFLKESYHNRDILSGLEEKWDDFLKKNKPGGVCDMTQLALFVDTFQQRGFKTWDMYNLKQNNYFIPDGQLSSSENWSSEEVSFRMTWRGVKKLKIKSRKIFGWLEKGESVRFLAGHFQGLSKRFIRRYHWATSGKMFLFYCDVLFFYPWEFFVKFQIKVIRKILKVLHIISSD